MAKMWLSLCLQGNVSRIFMTTVPKNRKTQTCPMRHLAIWRSSFRTGLTNFQLAPKSMEPRDICGRESRRGAPFSNRVSKIHLFSLTESTHRTFKGSKNTKTPHWQRLSKRNENGKKNKCSHRNPSYQLHFYGTKKPQISSVSFKFFNNGEPSALLYYSCIYMTVYKNTIEIIWFFIAQILHYKS